MREKLIKTYSLAPKTTDAINRIAKRLGISASRVAETALEEYVERDKKRRKR